MPLPMINKKKEKNQNKNNRKILETAKLVST